MEKIRNLEKFLSSKPVFNKISPEDRARLAEAAILYKLDTNESLTAQGDYWPGLLIVKSGGLKWTLISESGKEYVFFVLEPGDLFWGHTIFDEKPMPASLIATRPTELYIWKKDMIQPILYRYPEALWDIGKTLVGIMRRNREVVINLAFRPVAGRLAKYLLDVSDHEKEEIERDFTLEDIARTVASSPEVVCRVLYELQNEDILEVTRARITIHNQDALSELVENA